MISAKQIRAAACSVETSRRLGIPTQAAAEAPALLEQAEAAFDRMLGRLDRMGDQDHVDQGAAADRLGSQVAAYEAALEELRGALS